jgi:hypothetical protein
MSETRKIAAILVADVVGLQPARTWTAPYLGSEGCAAI